MATETKRRRELSDGRVGGRREPTVGPLEAIDGLDRSDAETYERAETLEGIARGVSDVKAGRTKPAQAVFARRRRKYGVPS